MDITNTNLEAALLDQNVAGAFWDKKYAYVAVYNDGWTLGVAVANEAGYNQISKIVPDEGEARRWARGLNKHIGLTEDDEVAIIASTMGGRPVILVRS